MAIYLYFKSGKCCENITQIRLTTSKNGTTGTAVLEMNIDKINFIEQSVDPVYGVGLQKENSLRMADICHFIWAAGKPIKLIAVFLFSNIFEKQEFFQYYPSYALKNHLEFFPALQQEKTLTNSKKSIEE